MGFLSPLKKAVGKVTNSKVAKSVPGGKSIGKSLRNAPGMKMPAPASSPIAPSSGMQAQQMPAMVPPQDVPIPPSAVSTPFVPEAPAPMGQDMGMGAAMGQPAVMPRQPQEQLQAQQAQMGAQMGLGPSTNSQANILALARQRMGRQRPM